MPGIVSFGAYVPCHRLERASVSAVLGTSSTPGTRAVACVDEDSTTLAVEAARLALLASPVVPRRLLFATSTPVYADKTNATAIHAALGLPEATLAVDAGGGLRSGMGVLMAALDSASASLIVSSDVRTGRAGGEDETGSGDGAACFIVGDNDVLARHLASASATVELMDRWRRPGDAYADQWEERFSEDVYTGLAERAYLDALEQAGIDRDDVHLVAVAGSHQRAVRAVQRAIGAAADSVTPTVGRSGTAHPGLLLVSMLERAQPGQVMALVSIADGVDVLLLQASDALHRHRSARPLADQLTATRPVDYARFLTWRGSLERQQARRPDPPQPAAPPSLRRSRWKFGFVGIQDQATGAVYLPPRGLGADGHALDPTTPALRANAVGTVTTFAVDHLSYSLNPPGILAVVDFDGGGRCMTELTDAGPDEVAVGLRVRMTFRRLATSGGVHNYFWKARPALGSEEI